MAEELRVFVSIGSARSDDHERALGTVYTILTEAGITARPMKKDEWSEEKPLEAIRAILEECSGAIVVAFPRLRFSSGQEQGKDAPLMDVRLPTVWNQIEGSMAYALDIPLLVIAENGLREEGLLLKHYNWSVFWTDLSERDLRSERFAAWIKAWKVKVEGSAEARKPRAFVTAHVDLENVPVKVLLRSLTIPQIWGGLVALVGALAAAVTLGGYLSSGKWPWQ